jgi:hypothetical protein
MKIDVCALFSPHPERDPQLPFPILNPQPQAPTVFPDPCYEGYPPNLFNARIESDEEKYPLNDSDEELVSVPSSPELKPVRMSAAMPTFGTTTRTVWDMPMRGSRDAPKTFRGHHTEVEYFIAHYDKLLVKFRVTSAYDQCECILDYCSTDDKDLYGRLNITKLNSGQG